MRFVVQSKKSTLINFLVILFSFSFYIFLTSLILLLTEANRLTVTGILTDIKGNPEEFLEPKPISTILEEFHINVFIFNTAILIISSILYRTTFNEKLKRILIGTMFLSMFFSELSVFGIVYVSDVFSYIKVISFWTMFLCMLTVNSINLYSFFVGKIK